MRLSAIGDVCHAVSMVTRIRRTRPDIKIVWVIGKIEHALVKGIDGVEFIVFDKKGGKPAIQQLKQQLGNRQFVALCMMQVALRANWVSRHIKADIRLGFDKTHSKEGHSLFINQRIAPQQHPHVLEGFHAFADALGIPKLDKLYWDVPIADKDRALAQQISAQLGPYMVICPAASKLERSWTVEGYADIANYCHELGYTPVLCGGPGPLDKNLAEQIQQASHQQFLSYVGQTSLIQMLAILDNASFVVSPDTGPAHMATMVDTPVIGLYAHSNPRRTGPYLSQALVVNAYDGHIKQQKGKDWSSLKWGTRAKGENLMTTIKVEQVRNQIDSVLSMLK